MTLATLGPELAALARAPDAPAVAVADRLIAAAAAAGASDVHVDPTPLELVIRFRLDGVLHKVATLDRRAVPTLVARLKVLADLPTYVVDAPQDGRIPAARVRAPADLRLSVVPTVHGERAVLRLFDPHARLLALHELGLPAVAALALERAVVAPRGVVLVCGPAGSGKSTTIHAALRLALERSQGRRSIVGIEDPVERVIEGVTQIQTTATLGFEQALRAVLRQDPEVIYLGEVRDKGTAGVAIEAGLTGHLVITTLHAGSCAQALARLLDMGVEPHLVTSAVTHVFAQRLLRRACPACATETAAPPALLAKLGPAARPRAAAGCPACEGTGYRGRLPVLEHAALGGAAKRAVLRRADESELQADLEREGLEPLERATLALVQSGATTVEEVERVLGPL